MSTFKINDLTQRSLALDPSKSFIVQAPAGSGKTTLLVERYLTLLATVNNPEEILAITFTRKAAYEMRSRIINALSQAEAKNHKLAHAVLKHSQQKNWHITQNPGRFRIQTIDAFCHYLISHAPIFTRITPNCRIVQNQEAEIYYTKAARAVLENIADPQYSLHLKCLLLHLDNDWEYVKNLFITMLKSREQWLPHIVGLKNTEELRQKMELALQEVSQENIERCIALFPKDLHQELVTILKTSMDNHDDPPPLLQKFVYEGWKFKSTLENWQGVASLLLTKEFSWRKKITKDHGFPAANPKDHKVKKELFKSIKTQMESLLSVFSQHEHLRLSLKNILLSPPPNYHNQQWLVIDSLLELLPLLAAHLKLIFNDNAVTDHAEISMAALRVLGEQNSPSDLALNLDYRLQHLLIDEFQDTSLAHYRLLEKLTTTWQPNDGRTIFVVGDPMQSIYRFREAEVGLFLRVARDGIGDIKLQPLTLTTNFRSAQNIIDWVNHNFAKVLPNLADIGLGAVPFRSSTAINTDPNSLVKVTLLKNSNDENEAQQLILTIQKILDHNPNDTIAILVKARKHLQKIIPALGNANLNYQAFELETLHESMIIRDLFSLTRALFDLTDRVAWLAILRAPWCGLTLDDLYQVANGKAKLIWDNISNLESFHLSANGKSRLIKLRTDLSPILGQRGRLLWRELVEKTWLIIGGPATATSKIELDHAAIYLDLVETPLDIVTLQKKLDAIYSPPNATAKIQIMTIHKAKGLEFDHVIIPGINRITHADTRKLLLWFERPGLHRGSSLLLAPIAASGNAIDPVYQYLQSVEQKKEFYETGRLLYVAMTRAKKSIYIYGNLTNSDSIQAGSLLEQLKPCFNEAWVQDSLLQAACDTDTHCHPSESRDPLPNYHKITNDDPSPTILRLTNDWQSPITIDVPQGCNSPQFALTDNQAAVIGTVIHQCLRHISESLLPDFYYPGFRRDDNWIKNYITNQQSYWRKLLKQEGYIDLDYGLKLINETINTTLQDKRGRWILSKHKNAVSELAITTIINGKFVHYIIDRTFIDENGIFWIIDYKTSTPNNPNINEFLSQEAIKYTKQLLEYAHAMRSLEQTQIIKLGLYFPVFAGWIEITNS